ncbi:MAG: hypothetical protein PUI48_08775 [Oscillospiraceae bacterium]|nr:hypothetical protein [Oscillospiraceae bacterium]MDY6207316.1 hypothetical protein [Oscillospiraceae bacterium]
MQARFYFHGFFSQLLTFSDMIAVIAAKKGFEMAGEIKGRKEET